MNTPETILIGLLALVFLGAWIFSSMALSSLMDKNTDLQKENSDLIEKILKLQEQNKFHQKRQEIIKAKYLSKCKLLANKKELLEVQDRLLKDKN